MTPRFIARADEITSLNNFTTVYFAHYEKIGFGMIFRPMDYLNVELLKTLNQKFTEGLNSRRWRGLELFHLNFMFAMLGEWEKAERALKQLEEEQNSFKMEMLMYLANQWYLGIARPVTQYLRVGNWLYGKVKRSLQYK